MEPIATLGFDFLSLSYVLYNFGIACWCRYCLLLLITRNDGCMLCVRKHAQHRK